MKSIKFLIFFLLFFSACANSSEQSQVCVRKKCFHVEIAKTQEEAQRGLMFRKSLEPDAGMLFVFPERQKHFFWMKNTLIPLDMIWLDYAQRIIYIEKNVPPCTAFQCPSYGPNIPSQYVLEINSGIAEEEGMKVGERLDFKLK